jgi:hypothetical protein
MLGMVVGSIAGGYLPARGSIIRWDYRHIDWL